MSMTTSTWVPAAYIVIGLLYAAWGWHTLYTEEKFDQYLAEERPPLPRRMAGQVFTGSMLVATLFAALLWPVLLPRLLWRRVTRGR